MITKNIPTSLIHKNKSSITKTLLVASLIALFVISPLASLTGLMKTERAFAADITDYSVTVPGTQNVNQNNLIDIPGVSISGGAAEDELNIVLSVTGGQLELELDNEDVTISSVGNSLLKISGTRAAINTALESLKYRATNSGIFQLTVRITSDAGEVIGSDGNAYVFVNHSLPWETARNAAATSTFQGVEGYLATITSEEENDVVATKLGSNGWIGLSDSYLFINEALNTEYTDQSDTEGKWYWLTGAEVGTQIWQGSATGTSIGGNFSNWASDEPNNYQATQNGENCAEIRSNTGLWNDMPCENGVGGYVVEYSKPAEGDFVSGAAASFTINVAGLEPESLTPVNNATGVLLDSKLIIDFGTRNEDFDYPADSFGVSDYNFNTEEDTYLKIYDSNDNLVDSLNYYQDGDNFEVDGTKVTITPHQNFSPNTTYYVQVDDYMFGFNGCECNALMWDGISDKVSWKFTTQAPEPDPTPVNNTPISVGRSSGYYPTSTNFTTSTENKVAEPSDLCPANQVLTQNLRSGARDGRYHAYTKGMVKEVKILQAHLNRLGFNAGPVDGILGRLSDGAIKRMQTYLGTKADGYVGPLTRALINKSCGAKGL